MIAVFRDQTNDLRMFSGDINQSTGRGRGIGQLTADGVHNVLYGPKAALEGSEPTARIVLVRVKATNKDITACGTRTTTTPTGMSSCSVPEGSVEWSLL